MTGTGGGTHGARPTGCSAFTGRTEPSAPTNGSADVLTRRRDTRVPPYKVRRFTGRTESSAPTKSVIARSAATRQSVLPSPKRRIPTPVTRSLARNDRSRRRDTRVPPYRVRRFTGRTESSAPTSGAPQPYTCTKKKSCPKAALFDLVISGVRLRSSPAPS